MDGGVDGRLFLFQINTPSVCLSVCLCIHCTPLPPLPSNTHPLVPASFSSHSLLHTLKQDKHTPSLPPLQPHDTHPAHPLPSNTHPLTPSPPTTPHDPASPIQLWIEGSFVFHREGSAIKPGLDYYAAGDFRYGSPMEVGG